MKCKTCHQETAFSYHHRCWCCATLFAASQRACGCEHLWEPPGWRVRGQTINLKGKTIGVYWSRTCSLCHEMQSTSTDPKEVPPTVDLVGLEDPLAS